VLEAKTVRISDPCMAVVGAFGDFWALCGWTWDRVGSWERGWRRVSHLEGDTEVFAVLWTWDL